MLQDLLKLDLESWLKRVIPILALDLLKSVQAGNLQNLLKDEKDRKRLERLAVEADDINIFLERAKVLIVRKRPGDVIRILCDLHGNLCNTLRDKLTDWIYEQNSKLGSSLSLKNNGFGVMESGQAIAYDAKIRLLVLRVLCHVLAEKARQAA